MCILNNPIIWFFEQLSFWMFQPITQGINCILEGQNTIGAILVIMGIIFWILLLLILKFGVFDILFPKIRVVDSYKNTINYCRRVINTDGVDPNAQYMMVKFKLFPIFRWHRLKLPKPNYKVAWRRMPSTLDILTEDIYLNWNLREKCYELGTVDFEQIDDDFGYYTKEAAQNVRGVGTAVTDAVKGDYELMKQQFQMELPITVRPEGKLDIPNIPGIEPSDIGIDDMEEVEEIEEIIDADEIKPTEVLKKVSSDIPTYISGYRRQEFKDDKLMVPIPPKPQNDISQMRVPFPPKPQNATMTTETVNQGKNYDSGYKHPSYTPLPVKPHENEDIGPEFAQTAKGDWYIKSIKTDNLAVLQKAQKKLDIMNNVGTTEMI